jgi:toxin-antitoxin system PIN domain toxin
VKLLDVNVVLAAHRADHPDHAIARPWLDDLLVGGEQFGVPWMVWWSFLRLSSHPRVFPVPTPLEQSFDFIAAVRARPGHIAVEGGARHLDCLRDLCRGGEVSADLVPDAVLAALAVEHGGDVVSFDRDFARFPDLRWIRPGR